MLSLPSCEEAEVGLPIEPWDIVSAISPVIEDTTL